MTRILESYGQGSWQAHSGETVSLRDASTGVEVARIATNHSGVPSMLEYSRSVGGPALRDLTFVQRAQMLKDLSKFLLNHIDEFVEISYQTGATRRDTVVDVDGGIGTLAVLANKALKSLPDSRVLADGDLEQLSKGGTFAGRHVYTSKPGVAVQINAFNFPVWGMLEKFAPAFLAGMPSLVKPASQTSYLTEAVVRKIVSSQLLPEGSISLLCAGAGRLLDCLLPQDTLSFTGSAGTSNMLKSHRAVVERGVRFNAEADSLNASILGPDVSAGSDDFNIFIDQIITEMTIKAGQKCTAIRRVVVPDNLLESTLDAISSRLRDIKVGNPRIDGVEMGPLASLKQRDEVRGSIEKLLVDCRLVFGDCSHVDAMGTDADSGAFISPILLASDDIFSSSANRVEPFGPVSTVLPYSRFDEALQAVALGEGSLVASLVTAEDDYAREFVNELAPWHGRLLITNSRNAQESTGHGVAMPQMLHGGPGRAGGGEELGGLRAVTHYMQRTAVQGHPDFLDSI